MRTTKVAFLFPGQGSQSVGMGQDLASSFSIAREIYSRADEILGFSISKLSWEGPEEHLNDTINTQPALMVHSVAALRVFQDMYPDLQPLLVAGHSMGQLSALVAAQTLSFEHALRLVRTRGELMKAAGENSPGGMAAILGLDIETLEEICASATQGLESVQVANDNCPGQVVISGATPALERAMKLANAAGARRAVPLAVSIAAHSPLMSHSQTAFNQAVDSAPLADPQIPIVGNVTARPLASAAQIRGDLQAQLTSRVRWTESIQHMLAEGVTKYLEIGSGAVLTGLLKRIDRQVTGIPLGAPADFARLNTVL
ncbi:MAG: ACP S-malonyltransferase [Anaerolineales bacterium]|jgi:[acyl-carrier-protein] S-malonyltransferase